MSALLLWLLLLFGVDILGPVDGSADTGAAANTGTTFTVADDGGGSIPPPPPPPGPKDQ